MEKVYYRISYKGIGIYEALKQKIWKECDHPFEMWYGFKNSKAVTWLKIPDKYSEKCYSYFNELGYKLFKKNTYQKFLKYFKEEDIITEKFIFDEDKEKIIYKDEHQIVLEKGKEE